MPDVRVAELLGALALTTDLAAGAPFEKALQVCLVADELGRLAGLDPAGRAALFQVSLLRSIGCTAHAPENAGYFHDDTAFQRLFRQLDPGDPDVFTAQMAEFGSWSPDDAPELATRFLDIAPTVGPVAVAALCEVSEALAPAFGAAPRVVTALHDIYERWDGLGVPARHRGEQVDPLMRIVQVAEQTVTAAAEGGPAGAKAELARRSGGHLDPALAGLASENLERLTVAAVGTDLLEDVLAREPRPWAVVPADRVHRMCAGLGLVADLKSRFLVGHSAHLAEVGERAGMALGLDFDSVDRIRRAALVHNVGCVVVPSSVLDRSGRLSAADRERLRLHGYWTGRILRRCPALSELEPIARPAAAHHAAFAEGGYRTWRRDPELRAPGDEPLAARVLEAAEVWTSLIEPRPGRPALRPTSAAQQLRAAAETGLIDPDAAAAVLTATTARAGYHLAVPSHRLTTREIEVLRLAARGLTNRAISDELHISERTVGHHLAHVFDKAGRRTRAGVAVWAVQHGLLPARE